jgi:hypothetical protein
MAMSDDSLKNIYSTVEDRIDTILSTENSNMWRMIVAARGEWSKLHLDGNFRDWLRSTYGVVLNDMDSGLSTEVEVIDNDLFLIFVLKYR